MFNTLLDNILKRPTEREFSVPHYGKKTIKTNTHLVDPQNSHEFWENASEICPNIIVKYYTKENILSSKEYLEELWSFNNLPNL